MKVQTREDEGNRSSEDENIHHGRKQKGRHLRLFNHTQLLKNEKGPF